MLCALTNATRLNVLQSTLGTRHSSIPGYMRPTSQPLQQQRDICASTLLIGSSTCFVSAALVSDNDAFPGIALLAIGGGLLVADRLLEKEEKQSVNITKFAQKEPQIREMDRVVINSEDK